MVLMDNCTGQNKSTAIMLFLSMLNTHFRKVVLFYFVTGHTKMIADRVVALWRKALKGRNFYFLDDIVAQIATVATLKPEVIKNNEHDKHCRSGWCTVLDKYIKKMPDGYTKNYIFEIEGNTITYRHSAATPIEESKTWTIFDDRDEVRIKLLNELFSMDNFNTLN